MPPAYIHLRCEIIGRFVQAYVPCTTAVFIPPSHPPSAYIQNYRHRIWYRYSLILFFWMTGRRQGTATDTRVAPVAESTQTLPPLPAPLPAKAMLLPICPRHHQILSQRTTWTQTTEQSTTRFPNPSRQFPTTQQRLICRRKHRCRPQQHQPRTQQQRLPAITHSYPWKNATT